MAHEATPMLEGHLGHKHALGHEAGGPCSRKPSQWLDKEPAYGDCHAPRPPS